MTMEKLNNSNGSYSSVSTMLYDTDSTMARQEAQTHHQKLIVQSVGPTNRQQQVNSFFQHQQNGQYPAQQQRQAQENGQYSQQNSPFLTPKQQQSNSSPYLARQQAQHHHAGQGQPQQKQKQQQQLQVQQPQQQELRYQQHHRQESGTSVSQFKKLRVIGRGAFGVCALYQDLRSELHEKVVIKSVSLECRNEAEKKAILSEAQLLRQLAHPNIIHLHSSFIEQEQLFIVMEFASGGTMERLIQERGGCALGQDLVLYYFTQITLAIHYIHSRKIMHRDLKTANIFLNRKRTIVKVGDFGISKELNTKEVASTVIGTANYLSPEICEGRAYDFKSDIWAMGCVLYELVELCKAFDGDSFPSVVLNITRAKLKPFSSTTSVEMRQLIMKMLDLDEQRRPATKKILVDGLIIKKWFEVHVELGRINPSIEECTRETYLIRKTTDSKVAVR